jgi:hypothetical protein
LYHISYIDEVSRLLSISVDDRCLPCEEPMSENSHDTGFPEGVLSRTIYIRQPEYGKRETMCKSKMSQVQLSRKLGYGIG